MIIFDFKCMVCEAVHEKLVASHETSRQCPECGCQAKRIISPVRCKLDPISGDFPGATLAWEKRHLDGAKNPSEQ